MLSIFFFIFSEVQVRQDVIESLHEHLRLEKKVIYHDTHSSAKPLIKKSCGLTTKCMASCVKISSNFVSRLVM